MAESNSSLHAGVEFHSVPEGGGGGMGRARSRRFSLSDMRSVSGDMATLAEMRAQGSEDGGGSDITQGGRQGSCGSVINGTRLVKLQPLPAELLRSDSGVGKPILAPSLVKKLPSFSGTSGRGKVVLDPLMPAEAMPTGKLGTLVTAGTAGGSKVLVSQKSAVSMTSAKT